MTQADETEPERKPAPLPAEWFPKGLALPAETRAQFARFADLKIDVPFPAYSSALKGVLDKRLAEIGKAASASVSKSLVTPKLTGSFAGISKQIAESFTRLPVIDPAVLASLAKSLTRFEPSNFEGLRIGEQARLIELSLKHSFATLEVLPRVVIDELLTSDGSQEDVERVLAGNADSIASHCVEVLEGVALEADPEGWSGLACDAATSLLEGHESAAQALATVVWDSVLTSRWDEGSGYTSRIKRTTSTPIQQVHADDTFHEFYWKAWLGPAVGAYVRPQKGDEYSRNGTVHFAARRRFGRVHAVQALTIATSLLGYDGAS